MVMPDGSVVKATRDNEYSDLYHCLPWSHGTLGQQKQQCKMKFKRNYPLFVSAGFLVGLELQLVRVKPYVRMEYLPVRGQREYCDKIRELSGADDGKAQTPDFVEATIYNKVNTK